MKIILKPLFDILTGDVAICDNILYNYLVLLVVGEVAYRIAWRFVGNLYRVGAIDGRASGSIIHWSIRFIGYVTCAYVIRGGIWLYNFVVAVPHWIWWLMAGIIVLMIVTIVILKRLNGREVNTQDDTGN